MYFYFIIVLPTELKQEEELIIFIGVQNSNVYFLRYKGFFKDMFTLLGISV